MLFLLFRQHARRQANLHLCLSALVYKCFVNDKEQEMYNPIEYSYQVSKNVFAGEHPLFDIYKSSIKGNIPTLLKFGITIFGDLT